MLLTLAAPDASTREKSKEGVRTGALFFLISGKGGRHRVGQGHHGVRRRGEQHGDGRRLEALELLVTRPGIAHFALAHLHVMRELVRVLVYELHGRHRGGELHFHFGHSGLSIKQKRRLRDAGPLFCSPWNNFALFYGLRLKKVGVFLGQLAAKAADTAV